MHAAFQEQSTAVTDLLPGGHMWVRFNNQARRKRNPMGLLLLLIVSMLTIQGCSVKKFTMGKLADALASSGTGTTFTGDDDPELIEAALPFSLKLMEALLVDLPDHRKLLLATASGFTQYSYAFIQLPADVVETDSIAAAEILRDRARRLYLRARNYGLRGLDTRHRDFSVRLRLDPKSAVLVLDEKDVPFLYWTAAAWGSAISISKDDPDLIADQLLVEALIDRAFELDPDYDHGAIHGFLITYEGSRQGVGGDSDERSRKHFEKVVDLTRGQLASPFVALAETVSVPQQNRAEFEELLNRALEIDVDQKVEWRLVNILMQRRARWLLSQIDVLFLPEETESVDTE
jgi:predicted anti-sigma-YlaC factor YlaD